MDVGTWLRGLGLEAYEQTFRDAAIGFDLLAELTDEHLKELGLPLGHRLKLLKAIAALRDDSMATNAPSGDTAARPRRRAPPADGAVL